MLVLVNNGAEPLSVVCDSQCFDALNISSAVGSLAVRDLWAHEDVATLHRPFSFNATVGANGAAAVFTLRQA